VVLGISWEGVGELSWLDARTLAPSGRRIAIGPPPTGVAARSPDGRTIALASGTKAELRFVDIRAMRATGRLVVRGSGGAACIAGSCLDPRGTRALVVSREAFLEVDLDAMAVIRQHKAATRAPAGAVKVIEGWSRGAVWLQEDTVAVFGSSNAVEGDRVKYVTTGVEIVDIASGMRRSLDPTATGAMRAGNVLLAFGGSALRGYYLAGELRFELLRGRDTGYVQTAGRWIYVGRDNSTTFTVVDARAGRVVGTARTPYPTIVLGN
jgi:hypothetical protein